MNKSSLLATMLLLSAVASPLALARNTPPQDPAATKSDAGAQVSDADLQGILKGLGYEVGTAGENRYEIEIKQGIYTLHPVVSRSPSGKKIWITASVRPLTAADQSNADFLLKLLKANAGIGPAQFYVENVASAGKTEDWRLSYAYPVDNRGVNSEVIKSALDAFATSLVENATLWDPATTKPKTDGQQ